MPPDKRVERLGSTRLFSSLSKKELAAVAAVTHQRIVEPGTEIVTEGDSGHEFFLIVSGVASVLRGARFISSLGAGSSFGETAILDSGPRSATVVADTECELLVLAQKDFMRILGEVPSVALKLLIEMTARLRAAEGNQGYSASMRGLNLS